MYSSNASLSALKVLPRRLHEWEILCCGVSADGSLCRATFSIHCIEYIATTIFCAFMCEVFFDILVFICADSPH